MASRDELRAALRQALKSRVFDQKTCIDLAKALRMTGLDPIADMDLVRLTQHLRRLGPLASAARRARLASSLDRIGFDHGVIAVARRGVARQGATPRC